jgi:hypothetical protein
MSRVVGEGKRMIQIKDSRAIKLDSNHLVNWRDMRYRVELTSRSSASHRIGI